MTSDGFALAAFILLLFAMLYFQMTSPTFLLVKLDVPQVTRLMRGQFNFYFLALSIAAAIGMFAFALAHRPLTAIGIGTIGAFAVWARRWFVQRFLHSDLGRMSGIRYAPGRLIDADKPFGEYMEWLRQIHR